jgi:hypothetical protein
LLIKGWIRIPAGQKLFAQSQDFQKQKKMHKIDKLARYFPKVGNSEYFSRKKLCQNKIDRFHLKHPVFIEQLNRSSLLSNFIYRK